MGNLTGINLPIGQWLDALVATSPLRHLLNNEANLWIAWDGKTVNISGITVGNTEWSRPCIVEGVKKNGYTIIKDFFVHKTKEPPLMEYSVVDILGQKWLGRGYPGHVGRFNKCKEI